MEGFHFWRDSGIIKEKAKGRPEPGVKYRHSQKRGLKIVARKKGKLEFRYYEIPHGEPLLALLGEAWVRPYGYDKNDKPIMDQHFHNLLEIGFCHEGRGELVFEDTVYPYREGTITVVPKNYPHTTNGVRSVVNRWEYLFIDMEKVLPELFPGRKRQAEPLLERINKQAICTTVSQQPELAGLVRSILREMTQRKEMYAEAVYGLMRAMFVEIGRCSVQGEEQPEPERPKKPEQIQISRALEYVGDYYAKPLKISDLAGACHMSETHFRRVFVRCMGMHPIDYINMVRVKMACERLRKTNEPIADVALKCGFTSLATFNRNFKKITGTVPNEWKKQPEAYERRLQQKNIEVYNGW